MPKNIYSYIVNLYYEYTTLKVRISICLDIFEYSLLYAHAFHILPLPYSKKVISSISNSPLIFVCIFDFLNSHSVLFNLAHVISISTLNHNSFLGFVVNNLILPFKLSIVNLK